MSRAPNKVDLRRLMQQKKNDTVLQRPKKIDSPLAKYSSSGQLSCVVCRTPVKSELAWTAHLASRSHKERVVALRESQASAGKRAADNAAGADSHKRRKGDKGVPDDFFEKPVAVPKKGILKNAVRPSPACRLAPPPPPAAPSQPERMETDEPTPQSDADESRPDASSRLQVPSSSAVSDTEPPPDPGHLPEGFFDDPQKDARARNVEYVDPVEAEWEKFQREMQSEMAESEVILDEDQQEATVGRQIEEVDEQIRNLSRVVSMERRKEELSHQDAEQAAGGDEDGDSSADEAEVEEFLDWRSKGAWK